MNYLDYVLFAIIALAALRCWFRGIIGEVLSTAAVLGGLLAGIFFYRPIGSWISSLVSIGSFEPIAGFIASFAIVFIIVKIIERSLRSVLENLNLDFLDKLLGFAFGALEGIIVAAVIILVLRYQPVVNVKTLLDESLVARLLLPIIVGNLPPAAGAIAPILTLAKA
jgi:membrane protein required for colicin V production